MVVRSSSGTLDVVSWMWHWLCLLGVSKESLTWYTWEKRQEEVRTSVAIRDMLGEDLGGRTCCV